MAAHRGRSTWSLDGMKASPRDLLRTQWRDAARVLGIECTAPIIVEASTGERFEFACLLPQFGGPLGTLVDAFDNRAARLAAAAAGYCLSTMQPDTRLPFNAADYVDCLIDWGWADTNRSPPDWYAEGIGNAV